MMAKLSMYLPPFAGDYSGACSTLFELDCLIIIVDAGCCTRNYVEYDEARWAHRRKSAFSAQLRTMDAVLGDDSRIIDQTVEAARELHPACIALVGTPVPAIVGMDLAGMAYEVEMRSGIPSVGLPTTGFDTYEKGASLALEVLCGRFATGASVVNHSSSGVPKEGAHLRVNILGATLHDFMGEEGFEALARCVRDEGFDSVFNTALPYGIDDVAAAGNADVSLVVSWSGLAAARLLQRQCGVPYVVGWPAGSSGAQALSRALREAVDGLPQSRVQLSNPASVQSIDAASLPPVLIVGDQVAANALRRAVCERFTCADAVPTVHVASFFSMEREWMDPLDFQIKSEADLVRFARSNPGFQCIGDPLLRRIPGFEDAVAIEFAHEAVSSTLFAAAPLPIGPALDQQIDAFAARYLS